MTRNQGIMPSFIPALYFKIVVLVDGSRTPIQGIGNANITPTLLLSSVFYLSRFPFNLLSVRLP